MQTSSQVQSALDNFRARRFSDAEQLCLKVLASSPDHIEALHLLGKIAMERRDCFNAQRLFRQAIALSGARADYSEDMADALVGTGNLPESLAFYDRATAIRPESLSAYVKLARTLRASGRASDAALILNHAQKNVPLDFDARYLLGAILLELARNDEAVRTFESAIELRPDSAWARFHLATALIATGRTREAVQALADICSSNPGFAEAHKLLNDVKSGFHKSLRTDDDRRPEYSR